MSSNRRKWYVVWKGTEPGVCDSWAECEARVKGYPGARYKSFQTQEEAVRAFREGYDTEARDVLRAIAHGPREHVNYEAFPEIVQDSIAVDGACSGNPGDMEYRGVDVMTGAELFHQGPFQDATNNVGEFLALVHALALFHNTGNTHTAIYSDSRTAMAWVRDRKCKTKLARTPRNERLFAIIARAEAWLATHTWANRIIKWQTDLWGEIPADFGRK
ncbi:MAG: ribonuclease H family protein [Muribaculaceae bacterium]|nr:ribonuclease H family protein [Muribaculaceae bacterium]